MSRRTNIYVDEADYAELALVAKRRGLTTSKLIRRAIKAYLKALKSGEDL